MPKLKTHSGAKKRFKVSGSGKLLRMKAHSSHLRRRKPASVKRMFAKKLVVSPSSRKRLARALPYGR